MDIKIFDNVDVVILGAGASGLWIANNLIESGYSVKVLASGKLGEGQTISSQGIIHTGIKYVFSGGIDDFVHSLHHVPGHWNERFSGSTSPNLSAVKIISNQTHIWSDKPIEEALANVFGIEDILQGLNTDKAKINDFHHYSVEEKTIDVRSLIHELTTHVSDEIIFYKKDTLVFQKNTEGFVGNILFTSEDGTRYFIKTKYVIFSAGVENCNLVKSSIGEVIESRDSPLTMRYIKGNLPNINGHIYKDRKLLLTITTTPSADESLSNTWVIGGGIAEALDENQTSNEYFYSLIKNLFDVNKKDIKFSGEYTINRSEPPDVYGRRFAEPFIFHKKNVLAVWPIKLTLVPRLASNVCNLIKQRHAIDNVVAKNSSLNIELDLIDRCAIAPWISN
ncbi:UNVERIFIED_ORG: hypothetical protein M2402_004307 [Rahnella aquatilis]